MGPRLETVEKNIETQNQMIGTLIQSHKALLSLLMSEAKTDQPNKEFYVGALSNLFEMIEKPASADAQNEMEM